MTAFAAIAHRWRWAGFVAQHTVVVRPVVTVVPSHETATSSPACGILIGLAFCAPFWIAVVVLVL
jgi:hypothetical protein